MEILECGPERPVGSSMWGCNQKAGRGILSHKKLNTHTRLATVDDIGNGKQALRQTKTFKNSCSQNSGDNWKRASRPISQTNIKPIKRQLASASGSSKVKTQTKSSSDIFRKPRSKARTLKSSNLWKLQKNPKESIFQTLPKRSKSSFGHCKIAKIFSNFEFKWNCRWYISQSLYWDILREQVIIVK